MFVRAILPELYRMQEIQKIMDVVDKDKPPEMLHQRGHVEDSPRIARYKAIAAAKEAANKKEAKSKGKKSRKEVNHTDGKNRC